MKKSLRQAPRRALAVAVLAPLSLAATANDVGVGVGVSYVFGQGPAVGIKAFSNDEDNEAVVSLGLDYVFASQSIRPNIGLGYQGEGYYGDANVGYSLKSQTVDFGIGGGWSNSDDDDKSTTVEAPAPVSPPPPPPPP